MSRSYPKILWSSGSLNLGIIYAVLEGDLESGTLAGPGLRLITPPVYVAAFLHTQSEGTFLLSIFQPSTGSCHAYSPS